MEKATVSAVRRTKLVDNLAEAMRVSVCAPRRIVHTGINDREICVPSFWTVKSVNVEHLLAAQDGNDIDGLFVDSVKHPARRDYK